MNNLKINFFSHTFRSVIILLSFINFGSSYSQNIELPEFHTSLETNLNNTQRKNYEKLLYEFTKLDEKLLSRTDGEFLFKGLSLLSASYTSGGFARKKDFIQDYHFLIETMERNNPKTKAIVRIWPEVIKTISEDYFSGKSLQVEMFNFLQAVVTNYFLLTRPNVEYIFLESMQGDFTFEKLKSESIRGSNNLNQGKKYISVKIGNTVISRTFYKYNKQNDLYAETLHVDFWKYFFIRFFNVKKVFLAGYLDKNYLDEEYRYSKDRLFESSSLEGRFYSRPGEKVKESFKRNVQIAYQFEHHEMPYLNYDGMTGKSGQ